MSSRALPTSDDPTTARALAESLVAPWAVWNDESERLVYEVTWPDDSRNLNLSVRWLDGSRMRNADEAWSELRAGLQFPWYFGRNWNAVTDCLRDLGWDKRRSYLVAIRSAETIMAEEEPESLWHFIELFKRRSLEFAEAYPLSFDQVRPPTPFHVLLHVAADQRDLWENRLQAEGLEIPWIPVRNPIS